MVLVMLFILVVSQDYLASLCFNLLQLHVFLRILLKTPIVLISILLVVKNSIMQYLLSFAKVILRYIELKLF